LTTLDRPNRRILDRPNRRILTAGFHEDRPLSMANLPRETVFFRKGVIATLAV
jgi:hypothetical protein